MKDELSFHERFQLVIELKKIMFNIKIKDEIKLYPNKTKKQVTKKFCY